MKGTFTNSRIIYIFLNRNKIRFEPRSLLLSSLTLQPFSLDQSPKNKYLPSGRLNKLQVNIKHTL